jgi:hypothetical protein
MLRFNGGRSPESFGRAGMVAALIGAPLAEVSNG